jgi:MoaA/NifB/PqqE/SkfB family radical SAM enzyme
MKTSEHELPKVADFARRLGFDFLSLGSLPKIGAQDNHIWSRDN